MEGRDTVLNRISESLKQLQHSLSPSSLEPSRLEWDAFLKKVHEINTNYKKLIELIRPELADIVPYPVKSDNYDTIIPVNKLFSIEDPTSQSTNDQNDTNVMQRIEYHNEYVKQSIVEISNLVKALRHEQGSKRKDTHVSEDNERFSMFEFLNQSDKGK